MDINALTLDSEVPPVQLVHVILWLETRVNSDVQVGNQNWDEKIMQVDRQLIPFFD